MSTANTVTDTAQSPEPRMLHRRVVQQWLWGDQWEESREERDEWEQRCDELREDILE